jgi:hypothetical protein
MILSWRKKDNHKRFVDELYAFIRNNPGIKWKGFLEPSENIPINYLEIGVFKGENVIDVSKSYCKHPESKLYCVDPWMEYDEYPEYKGKIEKIHDIFMQNITNENIANKLVIYRDFSHNVVPKFEDEFFDIAFIDGNHETEYVYKDGVMTLPKIKSGGCIIFDDYNWPQTKKGIDQFIDEYKSQIQSIKMNSVNQVAIIKL